MARRQKRRRADLVINNDAGVESLRRAVERIEAKLADLSCPVIEYSKLNRRMDPHGQRDSSPPRDHPARPAFARPPRRPRPRPVMSRSARRRLFPRQANRAAGATDKPRDRQDREPYREEGPADREPIRFIRQRDREPVREPVVEREPGMSVRERLARDRAERDAGSDPPRGNPDGSRSRP